MARKRTHKRDDIAMSYRIDSLPAGGVSKQEFFTTLLQSVESGSGRLPSGWQITWNWKNNDRDNLRSQPFTTAIKRSRSGFLTLMARRIRRDMMRAGVNLLERRPVRTATEAEIAALESEADESQEETREHEIQRKRKKRRRAKAQHNKRSKAAKRGWAKRKQKRKQ